ncbi:DUF6706 family protein [Cruoricaptor ignavus]|uniref:DUF6706 family protein n=1 Tax=Cruoricaptor ignavus TaxID=1118202 RepID=UPI00370DDEBC
MTNREYLTATLSRFGLNGSDVELLMVNQGLEADGAADAADMKLALYTEFTSIIPLADISEGGYSVRWNMDAVKLWYSNLARELGKENVLDEMIQEDINDASWRW